MTNQTNIQNHHYNLEGLARAVSGNNQQIGFYSKHHHVHNSLWWWSAHFLSHLYSSQNISIENSPLGTSQWTRKAKKTLRLTIQMIAKAVADVENLQAY